MFWSNYAKRRAEFLFQHTVPPQNNCTTLKMGTALQQDLHWGFFCPVHFCCVHLLHDELSSSILHTHLNLDPTNRFVKYSSKSDKWFRYTYGRTTSKRPQTKNPKLEKNSRSAQSKNIGMDFKEINFNSSPVKRIRFRGDSFQTENEPLIDNEMSEESTGLRNGEIPRERGLFTYFLISERHAISL